MPELPEVETVCRGLAAVLEGRTIARLDLHRSGLRLPFPPGLKQRVEGRAVTQVRRRAKFILLHLSDGGVMLAHLGMSGRMVIGPAETLALLRHDHVVLTTHDGIAVRFNDARRFGILDLTDEDHLADHPMLRDLGPEPLGNGFSGPVLAGRLAGRMTPIKAALLDQKTVAGIGNIYACEALFLAGLSPLRQASTVSGARAELLVSAIKDVLSRAIAAGGSSLRDYVQTSGELGYFQHQWAVYDREGAPCPGCTCGGFIRRIVQSGRSTFYCPHRQR